MFIKQTNTIGNGLFIMDLNQEPKELPINLFYSIGSSVSLQQNSPYFTSNNLIETYYL